MRKITDTDTEPMANYIRVCVLQKRHELGDQIDKCSDDAVCMAFGKYLLATTHTAEDLVRLAEAYDKTHDPKSVIPQS